MIYTIYNQYYTIKNLVFIFFLLETFMRGRQRVYTWGIIKAKIDMYHVNITESEGSLVNFLNQCEAWFATGNIWDLWISFYHFVKAVIFLWNHAHKERSLKFSLWCTWCMNLSNICTWNLIKNPLVWSSGCVLMRN